MLKTLAKWLRRFVDAYDPQPPKVEVKIVEKVVDRIVEKLVTTVDPLLPEVVTLVNEAEASYGHLSGLFRRRKVQAALMAAHPEMSERRANLLIEQALQ